MCVNGWSDLIFVHSSRVEVTLADGDYTLVQEPEEAVYAKEAYAPTATPDLKEPEPRVDQLGKHRSMT